MSTAIVTVGDFGGKANVSYSSNGTNWSSSSSVPNFWGAVSIITIAYGNGIWVAGANQKLCWSTDCNTWTDSSSTLFSQCIAIDYGDGKFVATGVGATTQFAYSSDGKSWTKANTTSTFFGTNTCGFAVKYANGYWVAGSTQGTESTRLAYSTNGIDWTRLSTTVFSGGVQSIAYGNSTWVAIGYGGFVAGYVSHPPTGTWAGSLTSTDTTWQVGKCVHFNGSIFVIGGVVASGGAPTYSSSNGINWTGFGATAKQGVFGITYYNGAWYAAQGWNGGVQTKTTGSWTNTTAAVMDSNRTIVSITLSPPSPPVISYANVFSNGSAIVSFSQTAATPAVTNYFYSTNGGTSFTNIAQTTSPIVITGLSVSTSYALILIARNTSGNSTMANVTVGTAPVITSITPKNLALTVNFTPSSGGTATNYLYSIDGGSTFVNSVATTTSPLQITGLTAGQSYSVAIKAAGTNWVSSNSSVTASTQPYNFGTVPVISGVVPGPGANALSVSFSLSTGAYDTPTYYYSYLGNTASNYNLLSPTPTVSPNTFVINNLPGTSQSVVVLAINGAGNLYSTAVSQTPYYLGTRPNITRIQSNANALNVAFTGSQNANPTPYYYYSVNGSVSANTGLNATGNIVIPGLTTYGNYAVQIVAVSAAGNISSNIAYGFPFVLGSTFNVNNSGLAMNYLLNTDLLDYATGTGVNAYNVSGTVSYVAGTGANTILGNGGAFFGNTNLAGFQPVQNITVGTNGATAATWIKLTSLVPTLQKYTRIFEFVNSVTGLPFFSLQFDKTFTNIAVAFESGIVFSCPFVADTNWHHYCVIINSAGNFTLYVDNILRLQNTYGNYSATFANQINSCYVGGTNDGLPYSI